jgi:hypothetical protein
MLLSASRANAEQSNKQRVGPMACRLRFLQVGSKSPERRAAKVAPQYRRKGDLNAMTTDKRDILELLKEELDFIESGGYGRSVRTPWRSKSTFQDSLSCINYGYPYRAHSCNECHLLDFVTPEHRTESVPCHFIPLNTDGETIQELESQDNQAKLEREVGRWLRDRIKQIEEERANTALAGARG